MNKFIYILTASSMILGSALSIPLQSTAEISENDSETLPSTSSISSTSSSAIETASTTSNSSARSTEISAANSQATTSSTSNMPESRATTIESWLPDAVLQQLVAKAVGKTKDTLTQEDMLRLTSLSIQSTDSAIASLKGLELATNLDSFYMNSNSQISDFSVLAALPNLKHVYLMGTNVNDTNVPDFGAEITRLNLSGSSVTNGVYDKIKKMSNLESLSFESNMNITTIEPLTVLTKLNELRVQFCGITDFKPINQMPALTQLAAFGQNTGRNDPATAINAKELNYDADKQTIYIPFSIMPNRMTNYDGYVPPFTTSNSASQTYFDFNGVQLDSSRLAITEEGITVSGVTQEEFEQLQTFKYNARLNNPAGSYNQPERFSFYAISAGTYLHQFNIQHTVASPGLTIKYVDEDGDRIHENQTIEGNVGDAYDTTAESYLPTIPGYTLDETQLPQNATGSLTADPLTVTYIYKRNLALLNAHDSTIYVGENWKAEDNFDGGTDPKGSPITFEDVSVDGSVDTTKVGKYEITYSYDRVPNRIWPGDHATAKATVTVIDKKEAKPLTVTYVDPTGKEIHEKNIVKGELGAAFDVSGKEYQPAIKGYILDDKQLPKNAKGTFSDQAQTVVYVYQPEMKPTTDTSDSSSSDTATTDTVSSSQPTDKSSDSSKNSGKAAPAGSFNSYNRQTVIARNTSAKSLPKTGETRTSSYLLAGISVLIFAIGLLLFSHKKAKQ